MSFAELSTIASPDLIVPSCNHVSLDVRCQCARNRIVPRHGAEINVSESWMMSLWHGSR